MAATAAPVESAGLALNLVTDSRRPVTGAGAVKAATVVEVVTAAAAVAALPLGSS